MIGMREHIRKGVHTQGWGCTSPRDMTVDGCVGLFGHIGSMEGHDKLFKCGFTKGHDTPKRHDVFTQVTLGVPIRSQGNTTKEGRIFDKIFG
jgi:hypothetical protein